MGGKNSTHSKGSKPVPKKLKQQAFGKNVYQNQQESPPRPFITTQYECPSLINPEHGHSSQVTFRELLQTDQSEQNANNNQNSNNTVKVAMLVEVETCPEPPPYRPLFHPNNQSILQPLSMGNSTNNVYNGEHFGVTPSTSNSVHDDFRPERGTRFVPDNHLSHTRPQEKQKPLNVHENNFDFINDSVQQFSETDDDALSVLEILSFPEEWSSCNLNKTGFVNISFSSPEGRSIHKFFHRTSHTKDFELKITGISRIENVFLHSLYMLKKEELKSRNGHVDELFLYHGTKIEHVENICENNLNWRMFSGRHRFGQGVSFSPLATYSSHYCDSTEDKIMLLFKVLISNVVIGSSDMCVPPNQGVTFDTSMKEDTSVIVKYSDNEFYPLYIFTFTKCSRSGNGSTNFQP